MATTATTASAARRRAPGWLTASWIGLLLLGAFNLYAALADLAAGAGLLTDHTGTFTAVTGRTWASFKDAQPGAAHYITLVERGYALHDLVFAALFLVIVTIPLRAGQRCCGVEHEGVGDLADLQGGTHAGDGKGWQSLTPSERAIVDLVAVGLPNPQIGQRLYVSRRTVQAHLGHVFAKLHLTSRAQLAAEAARHRG